MAKSTRAQPAPAAVATTTATVPWRPVAYAAYLAWASACLAAFVALVGVRWLRYSPWSEVAALDAFLREAMVVDAQAFLWMWVYTNLKLRWFALAAVLVVVCLHRRFVAAIATRDGGVWRLRRPVVALLLAGMVWIHYGFDMNPTVAAACASSIALVSALELRRVRDALPPRLAAGAVAVLLGAWLLLAHDLADRLTIAVWAGLLLASHLFASPRVGARDLLLLRALTVVPMNILPAVLPLLAPMHGGRPLGDGLAYSFCEVPGRGTVYAALPVCDSVNASYEACRDGRVVEYDRRSLAPVAEHRFFSPDFHGRLELMVCLDDEVQVSLQALFYRGEHLVQSAMAFSAESPSHFSPVFAGAGSGNSIAFDRAHDAIFYTGEFNDRILRYDRRTRQFAEVAKGAFARPWTHPFSLARNTGSLTLYSDSVHPGRNRIYLSEWMQGRDAHAIDLDTLQPVARYDVGGGGAMGITVDPERDRLYVSSLWGLEVFDLASDRLVARVRTGLGNRPVIVDAPRNRLYLASMVEGKIRVLDRDSLAVIGQIPIGIGPRYAHLSLDGDALFASSTAAHYAWDADALGHARPTPASAP